LNIFLPLEPTYKEVVQISLRCSTFSLFSINLVLGNTNVVFPLVVRKTNVFGYIIKTNVFDYITKTNVFGYIIKTNVFGYIIKTNVFGYIIKTTIFGYIIKIHNNFVLLTKRIEVI